MVGRNKSVYTELKREIPSLTLVKCVCHSIQLAINHASKECLPHGVEFLIYETYNWFSKSSSRRLQYKQIFQLINDENAPLKIPRVSDTRWLSIEGTVSRILQQWLEMKTHFGITSNSEKCHKAEILYEMYKDERNYLYLLFLRPILAELLALNNSFQSNNTDPTKLLKDFAVVINSLKSKIISPDNDVDVISIDFELYINKSCYLGYNFEKKILEMKSSSGLTEESEKYIRTICTNFVVVLINQLKQRLPDNFDTIKKVNMFSVGNVLRASHEEIEDVLKHFNYSDDMIEKIIIQYNRINFVKWNNISNTMQFWAEVQTYTDAGGNKLFSDLAEFALHLLSLPWSNADVERLFSQLNLVKTKLRNSIHLITINAILSIRYGLKRHNKCCTDYEIPRSYLKMIGTNKAYENQSIDYNNQSDDNLYKIINEL
ncbi:uncharacterized protein LOC118741720 isoform X2 [Rhagoletis pomonella]|uniref:uncharacterized protein LOC118741720 isoform X2 n=2 Tax=Rhagoletis pomonella TaxID=28610 RepID=UPI001783C30D|nr:uncharacterized protein LOC118741720 isoform X2 [Rhagoletis pomonella]